MSERREMVMLAEPYNPTKHKTEGSYWSEKLDGMRCFWLPETRGMDFKKVIFANTNRDERNHVCTGLWTRYGKPIFAPEWLLDQLPLFPLDGELYAGRGNFQDTMSICKKFSPDSADWKKIGFYVFDIPSYSRLLQPGRINNPNFAEKLIPIGAATGLGIQPDHEWYSAKRFELNYNFLAAKYSVVDPGDLKGQWGVLRQVQLPMSRFPAEAEVHRLVGEVSEKGGEGLILRRPHSFWTPKRTSELMKVKPRHDTEGRVVGFKYGSGKLHGMIGSVKVMADFGQGETDFDMSGFTDAEREVDYGYRQEANLYPGKETLQDVSRLFKIGDVITFTYRELTRLGKPKEAQYLRKRLTPE